MEITFPIGVPMSNYALSRRGALRGFGVALAAGFFPAPWALGEEKKPFPSHSPTQITENKDLRAWVREHCMAPPTARKVTDQIFYSSGIENVTYLDLGERALLLDTGFDHQILAHLANFEKLGCNLKKVAAILCSHSHVDHTGGLKMAKDRLGVPVVAHPRAIGPIGSGDKLQTAAVIPELDGWEFDFPACKIDQTVDHGDTIQVGAESLRVVHIPGHTPDSLGYVWRGHFFTGDAVFGAGLIGWAHERWQSSYADHAETMQRLIDRPPGAERFYCTHGPDLPYSDDVPRACLKTLAGLLEKKEDPCNKTPRVMRRGSGDAVKVLAL